MNEYKDTIINGTPKYTITHENGTTETVTIELSNVQEIGTALNKVFFDSIKSDLNSRLLTASKATEAQAKAGADNTNYMTSLRTYQQCVEKFLPSKQISIKNGTISDGGTIPKTAGYSNYLYIVTPNDPSNNFDSSKGHPSNFAGYRMYCSVNQGTRKVTAYTQGFYYVNGSSNDWENIETFTVNYFEIAWN